MSTMFISLFAMLPFFFTETTLPALLFLTLAGGGAPTDLAAHLPDDVVAYARIAGQEDASAAVKKAVEGARGDAEFKTLMDAMIGQLEKDGGFKDGGFGELCRRIRAVHVAVYSFGREDLQFTLVFETTGEDAAAEILDHSDRFFREAMFEKGDGEGRYRFAPAGDEGLAIRVKNLVLFGTAAETTAAALATPPAKPLVASETWRKAVGEAGGSYLLGFGNGTRFFADLKASLDFDDQKEFDQVDSFIGFTEVEWLRISSAYEGGAFRNETIAGIPEDAVARVFAPKESELDADLFLRAGGETGFALQIADPKAYWTAVEAHLLEQEKSLGWDDVKEFVDGFEEAAGKPIAEVLGLLDGRVVLGMPSFEQMMNMESQGRARMMRSEEEDEEPPPADFPVTFAIRLADPAGAEEFIGRLLSKDGPMGEEVETLEPTTHAGVSIRGFVLEHTKVRWYVDGNVLVLGGADLEASIDRARGEGAAAARTRLQERLGRVGPNGFLSYLGGGNSGMMSSAFLFMAFRASYERFAEPGQKRARRVDFRKPIRLEGETDAVGTARFEAIGLVARSLVAVDAATVGSSSAMMLRMYFEAKVDGCLSTLSTIYTALHSHHDQHDAWPKTLEEAINPEEGIWIMGCPDAEGSQEKPSSAYTYLIEKPAGSSDEEALWVFDSEQRHPFGRAVLYRDGKVTFLYEDEFQKALAKSK